MTPEHEEHVRASRAQNGARDSGRDPAQPGADSSSLRTDGSSRANGSAARNGAEGESSGTSGGLRGKRVERSATEILQSALTHGLEVTQHIRTLLKVRADRAQLSVRHGVALATLAVAVATVVVPFVVGGVALVVLGIAQVFAHWLAERAWLANLVSGVVILSITAGAMWIAYAWVCRRELARKVAKYSELDRSHAERFGAPASSAPAAPAPPSGTVP
jgi:hypothetical protein